MSGSIYEPALMLAVLIALIVLACYGWLEPYLLRVWDSLVNLYWKARFHWYARGMPDRFTNAELDAIARRGMRKLARRNYFADRDRTEV